MPLPSDERLIALGNDLLAQFDKIFGLHPGFRPAHAKGLLLTGTFTPSAGASSLTRAPHVARSSTPVVARFSNSTGLPLVPDTDPNANPRGLAIRFQLAEHVHTDIISHSTDGFPTRTGDEFLEFLTAVAGTDPAKPHPNPVEAFLASHPAALRFVQTPKPSPASFASENYFGVTAFRFSNSSGESKFGRYRIVPEAGAEYMSDEDVKGRDANFLFDELKTRIANKPIGFRISVQIASGADVVDDATIQWAEDRPVVELGTLSLTSILADSDHQQKQLIFDPIPRVDGIEPSADPLLELRAAIYLLSGRRRRQALESMAAREG